MDFKTTLMLAKTNDSTATMHLINQYKPLLVKSSIINGRFDNDLHQTLIVDILVCIQLFHIEESEKSNLTKKEIL